MPRTVKKPENPPHFLFQWRKFHHLSLNHVSDLVREIAARKHPAGGKKRVIKNLGATHGNLSRIERFEVPYNQILLELLAEVYKTDTASLIDRDPNDPERIHSIWREIPAERRRHAADVMRTFTAKPSNDDV